jgi:prepilin-type N-terminal cleavage/methylation domain-containing protein/prepilin-type processing-associated H-X9-DG protein
MQFQRNPSNSADRKVNRLTTGSKTHRTGFTLIELLVVIAIIAILAAILFPVFGRARENARRSSCTSNMKQIGLGVMQYTQDYDEFLPPSRNTVAGKVTPWHFIIQPYIKSTQVFRCPSVTQSGWLLNDSSFNIERSYYSNAGQTTGTYGPGGTRPMSDTQSQNSAALQSISTTILIVERNDPSTSTSAYNDKLNDSREIYDPTTKTNYLMNHLGMSNYLFADGHAKSLKPIATIQPTLMWITQDQNMTAVKTNWRDAIQNAQSVMK